MQTTTTPLRLVLDTNVWLDWLAFDDTTIAPLKLAHAEGGIEIFSDEACTRELIAVLNYDLGKRSLDAGTQKIKFAEFQRLARPHPGPPSLRRGGSVVHCLGRFLPPPKAVGCASRTRSAAAWHAMRHPTTSGQKSGIKPD
jgi:hypothetical protein